MGFEDLGRELGPIAFFAFIILLLGVTRYSQTLDRALSKTAQGVAFVDWALGAAGRSIAINSETVANL